MQQRSKGKKLTGFKKYPQFSLSWDVKQVNPCRSKGKDLVIKLHSPKHQNEKRAITKMQSIVINDYFPTQSNYKQKDHKPTNNSRSQSIISKASKQILFEDPVSLYGLEIPSKLLAKEQPKQSINYQKQQSLRSTSRSSSKPKDNIQSLGDGYNYFKEDPNARTPRGHKHRQLTQKITAKSPKIK